MSPRSCRGVDLAVSPARSTPSWAPTARASRPWPTPCSAAPSTRSPAGRIRFQGDDITDWPTDVRAKAGMFLAFQYPQEIAGRLGPQLPAPGAVGPQGHRPLGARAAPVDHGVDEAPRHGPVVRRPLPQRGLLRRREEAQRDPADGDPRARARDPRRDRLRPRHRRAARWSPAASQEVRADRPELGVLLITHYQRLLDDLDARPRAHPGRRPHRRQRRPGARRAARSREGYDAWR